MADKKISALTAASTPLAGTEVLPIVQGGSTVKVSIANVTAGRAVAASSVTTTGNINTTAGILKVDASGLSSGLQVDGYVPGSAFNGFITNNDGSAGTAARLSFGRSTSSVFGFIQTNNNSEAVEIGTDGVVRLTASKAGDITASTGNLVIGTTAKGITTGSAIPLGFGVNNAVTSMTLDTSGNLLVGNTTQLLFVNKELNVNAASGSAGFALATANSARLYMTAGSTNGNITTKGAIPLLFGTNETTRARIDSSGNFLIAKTDADFAAVGFEYLESSKILRNTASGGAAVQVNRLASDGDIVSFFRNTSAVGSISVTTTGTSYTTISDARLKHNIVDATEASDLIDAIKVRSFKWKADDSKQQFGFVAQELLEVAPEVVSQSEDEDKMMGVDYAKLVPMLVKEVQSLRARVAQLEGK